MNKTYTFSEAQKLLNIDAKTFRRWLKKAEIDPKKQVSQLDERIRYLTEDQLKKLAKEHDKDLTTKQENTQESGLAGKLKLLTERFDRLDSLYTIMESHTDALEHRIAELERRFADQAAQIQELQQWKQAQESRPKAGRKPRNQGEAQAQGED